MRGYRERELAHDAFFIRRLGAKQYCLMKNIEPPCCWQQIMERTSPGFVDTGLGNNEGLEEVSMSSKRHTPEFRVEAIRR